MAVPLLTGRFRLDSFTQPFTPSAWTKHQRTFRTVSERISSTWVPEDSCITVLARGLGVLYSAVASVVVTVFRLSAWVKMV